MPLAKGCHHIAILTEDLDRFVAFYRRIFDADLLAEGGEGPLRHALVDVGGMSLHPFEFLEDPPPEARGRL